MGTGIIIAIVITLNLLVMGNHGGRGGDYIEQQDYTNDIPVETPKTVEELKADYEVLKQLFESPSPAPTIKPN